jgi:HSP20 family protein
VSFKGSNTGRLWYAQVGRKARREGVVNMPSVPIRRIKDPAVGGQSLFQELENLFAQIKERAYSLFQQRGSGEGGDLDDWLRAEREFLWTPPADLIDTGEELRVRIAAPGFEADEIDVTALPNTIIVRGESKQEREQQEGEVLVSEFSSRKLYRRFDLPAPIDPDEMTAKLEKGVLHIAAPKSEPTQAKKIAVASGG